MQIMTLTYDKNGMDSIKKTLTNMKVRARDIHEVSDLVQKAIEGDVQNRFKHSPFTQVGGYVPGKVYWRRLKKSTLRSRPDRFNKPIMIDTGALVSSLKLGSPNNIASYTHRSITFGSKLPYAGRQNQMRPYMFMNAELHKAIRVIIKIFIKHGKEMVRDMKYNNIDINEQER